MPLTAYDRAALNSLLLRERGFAQDASNPAAGTIADCAAVLERAIAMLDVPGDEEIETAREAIDTLSHPYLLPPICKMTPGGDETIDPPLGAKMRGVLARALDALARERRTHHTTIRKSEHGWAVWVHDYKVCEHSEQDRARDCAEALEGAIFRARTMVSRGSSCPEIGRPSYQRVWLSEEALKLARERLKLLVECGVADGASVADHPDYLVWLLARDLGLLPKENG